MSQDSSQIWSKETQLFQTKQSKKPKERILRMRPYLPQGKKSTTFANRSGSSTPRLTASMKVCRSNCCSNRRICRQAKLCQRAFHCQVGKTSEATAELETRFRLDGNRSPRLLISRDWTLRGYNGSLARVIISCKTFLWKKDNIR